MNSDLARLYGVETRRLKEQVRRNIDGTVQKNTKIDRDSEDREERAHWIFTVKQGKKI